MKALRWIIILIAGIVLVYAGAIAALLLASDSNNKQGNSSVNGEGGVLDSILNQARRDEKAKDSDLSGWSANEIAAQLCVLGARSQDVEEVKRLAQLGLGGVILIGSDPASDLKDQLEAAKSFQNRGVRAFFVCDEEGGLVQRMRNLLGPLPSAAEMGKLDDVAIRNTTFSYGQKLKNLGVDIVFAPSADLQEPGAHIESTQRAFSSDPKIVAQKVVAWSSGMQSAGIPTAVKHWPGLGGALDTHEGLSSVPSLAELEKKDFIPFKAAFDDGCKMVMVGHVMSSGLTEPGLPTSISPKAMKYLRKQAGNRVVIVTDSMTMVAASKALGITPEEASVRALIAGVDLALVNGGKREVVDAVENAIESGRISRELAEEKVRRILALKAEMGLAPQQYAYPE